MWEDPELSHNNSIDPSITYSTASDSADPDSHDGVQEEHTGTSKEFSHLGGPAQVSQELPEVVVEALAGPSGMQEVYETVFCVLLFRAPTLSFPFPLPLPFLSAVITFPSSSFSYSSNSFFYPVSFSFSSSTLGFSSLLLGTITSLYFYFLLLFLPFSVFSGFLFSQRFKLCNIIFLT